MRLLIGGAALLLVASCAWAGHGGYDDGTGTVRAACSASCIETDAAGMCIKFSSETANTCADYLGKIAATNKP